MAEMISDILEAATLLFLCDWSKRIAFGEPVCRMPDVVHATRFLAARGFRVGVDACGRLVLAVPHEPALNAPGPGGWQ
jgi:hypothetical protein